MRPGARQPREAETARASGSAEKRKRREPERAKEERGKRQMRKRERQGQKERAAEEKGGEHGHEAEARHAPQMRSGGHSDQQAEVAMPLRARVAARAAADEAAL